MGMYYDNIASNRHAYTCGTTFTHGQCNIQSHVVTFLVYKLGYNLVMWSALAWFALLAIKATCEVHALLASK